MNKALQQGLLRLIYSAVSGETVSLPEGFDFEQAMPLIKKHQIGNLVYYGAVNCGMDKNLPVMQELFAVTYKSMLVDERQRIELKKLMDAFDAAGIHYMPVKGVLVKQIYPKPDMRIMGDADILIKLDQYGEIHPIMERLGFSEKLESDHELIWEKPSLYLELHKRLIPSYNSDYAAYYGDGWQLGHPSTENPCRYEMTDEDQMIYLFTHFAKHYRDGGIGVRHMLDLYLYQKAKPDMDAAYLRQEMGKLQLNAFYDNICRTLAVWFENGQEDAVTQRITQWIFHSGVYGIKADRIVANSLRVRTKKGSSDKQLRAKRWAEIIFPPYSSMCILYPFLKKIAVLLPIMWVVRWLTVLFKKPESITIQRNKVNVIKEESMEAWENQIHEVGLAFNFEEKAE